MNLQLSFENGIDGEVRIVRVRGPGQPNLKLSELPLE